MVDFRFRRNMRLALATLAISGVVAFLLGCGGGTQKTLPPVEKTTVTKDTMPPSPVTTADTTVKSAWIVKPTVNARSGPSTSSQVIRKLSRGTEVRLLEKKDQWWKVTLDDTTTAYINESMLSTERLVDPWTQFRLGAKLADSSLQIISEVNKVKGVPAPSASLTVAKEFSTFSKDKQQTVAESAFTYWKVCLQKGGYDFKGTYVVLVDPNGKELITAAPNGDKISVEFIEHE
jgi:hypothetical protein